MFFKFKVCFCQLKKLKMDFCEFSGNQKICYRLFPMISGHGAEKTFSMGFEILVLVSEISEMP